MTGIRAMDWELALSPPQAWSDPAAIDDTAAWQPAIVPGTAAGATHDQDVWYRTSISGRGVRRLRFEGLATTAEVYLDGKLILTSNTMFAPCEATITLDGSSRLHVAFRSLNGVLAVLKGPRARWKTMMITEPKLRFVRTTLLGHMPGWCPPVAVVGPYRAVTLIDDGEVRADKIELRSRLDGLDGVLTLAFDLIGDLDGPMPVLRCAGHEVALTHGDGRWHATLRIPDVELWWPHTHGQPALHEVNVEIGSVTIALGDVGFRRIELERGPDGNGFTLLVNGARIFCRGACWTPIDVATLQATDEDYARELGLMRRAGLNMLRLSGTMVYETPAFHHLCDRLGIMVWQDVMLANFDYPSDEAFADVIRNEVGALIDRIGASPSLVVMCGGSEVGQQAAMMGLPSAARSTPLADSVIPELLADHCDAIYVPGSPSGGALPFVSESGPSHYYGVGAYMRPLDDARRANVRFASECLAFANLPDDRHFAAHDLDANWPAGVPRDGGASWDFDDVREHYLQSLWGEDGRSLRPSPRWRALSRAISAEVIERTIDEWRRPASHTAGALLWLWRDLQPGAGWGLVDVHGQPKAAFYGLRRAAQPLRLSITDEGTNGLYLHLVNDTPQAVEGTLRLRCLKDGKITVIEATREVGIAPHAGLSIGAFDLFDRFFDAGHCYRFGPAPHDTVHASFNGATDAFHFLAPPTATQDGTIDVTLEQDDHGFYLTLQVATTTRFVEIVDDAFQPDDNFFHLAPGPRKIVRLRRIAPGEARPCGRVSALTLSGTAAY